MPATIALLSTLAATDPQVDVCGPKGGQGWLCATVYRLSHSTGAAEVADALARPIRIVFVVALAWIGARIARRAVMRLARHVRDDRIPASHPERSTSGHDSTALDILRRAQRINTIASVLCNVISVVVWTVAGMAILSDLGVDLAPFIAGAGVLTVVIGFGAQTVVRDFLSGLFIVLEDQFGVGDVIDVGEATGTVEAVSLRTTRLRDVEGVVWYVPNGEIKRVGNKSQQWSRALLDIAVANTTDINRATDVIKRTADEMWREEEWREVVLAEPEVWGVEDVGIGGILIRLVVKTLPHEQWRVARALRARVKGAFDQAGIEMPVAQQRITYEAGGGVPPFAAGDGATDGD